MVCASPDDSGPRAAQVDPEARVARALDAGVRVAREVQAAQQRKLVPEPQYLALV